jgi:DNA-binding Lrp family transcriptional regulator
MATWSKLTEAQKAEVVSRITIHNENLDEIAIAFGLKASSLLREIRKLKAKGDIDKYQIPIEHDAITGESSVYLEDGNEAELEWQSGSGPIKTLPELIKSHHIDLEICPRAKRNADGFDYFQNHQVKARFVKINPTPIFPIIQPLTINAKYKAPKPIRNTGIGIAYIFADPHFGYIKDLKTAHLTPFHNRRVMDLHLQLIEIIQPDRVEILGDWLDMAEWTDRFMKEPEFYWTTQPALLESGWWLQQIREIVPNAYISMHQGNHEMRLDNAIKTHLPGAYGLKAINQMDLPPALSIPNLLALHELHVEWIGDYPEDKRYINNRLGVKHGSNALSPGQTAKRELRDITESILFGHIHRREMLTKKVTSITGDYNITSASVPCSCWTDGRVPGSKKSDQWQNGTTIAEYEIGGDYHNLSPILFEDNRCIYRGEIYEGRDRMEEIKASMDNWSI